jgi:non-specific serine/threonine protein kinase/serine/threonine-protein kinase
VAPEEYRDPGAPPAGEQTVGEPTLSMSPVEAAGSLIGRYKLLQKIGEGGMGEVWLAEQREPIRRRVAVKLIRSGMNRREVNARFESERQALAMMDHPAIAKVLDGGATQQGDPYFVMEYVAGLPITEYCDTHKLTTAERLELFASVCEGVQHAHQKAIIHRDLKPSNILVAEVDGRAMPKIIDFGVAKALSQKLTDGTMFTRVGTLVGTPEYMSPEQALSSGEDIDTRTDVYSLGIVFYELLAGAPPIDLRHLTLDELLRRLRDVEPSKPSTKIRAQSQADSTETARLRRTAPLALAKQLRGDLDSIALRALEKDRSRRYASASDFSADIRRYLRGEPVLAVPHSAAYRARKFVRRHWAGVLAASLALAGVLGGAGIAVNEARIARHRFEQVRNLANRFLFDFDKEIAPIPGTVKAREMIVSTALQYLDSLRKDASGDPQLQWELASAYAKVADVQGSPYSPSLNHPKDAIASSEKGLALARALAERGRLTQDQIPELVLMLRTLQAILDGVGEFSYAEKIGQEQVARSAGLSVLQRDSSVGMLGYTYMLSGNLEKARQLFEQSVQLSRQLITSDPSQANRLHLASSLRQLGTLQGKLARLEEARSALQESLALYRQYVRERPENANARRNLGIDLDTLAIVTGSAYYPSLERAAEAQAYYAELLGMLEAQMKADPKDRSIQHDLGAVMERAAFDSIALNPERALAYAKRAVELRDASDDNPGEKAAPRVSLSQAHLALKQYAEAAHSLKEAGPLLAKGDYENERDFDLAWARLESARGNPAQAADWGRKGIAAGEAAFQAQPVPTNALCLARVLELAARVDREKAAGYRRRAVEVWQDQNRRYPGAYVQQRAAEAEKNLAAR